MWEPPGGAKLAAHSPNIFQQEARLRRCQQEWEETWRKGVSAGAGGQGNKPVAAAAPPPPPGLTDVAFGRGPLAAQLPKKCSGLQRAPCARVSPGQLEPIAGSQPSPGPPRGAPEGKRGLPLRHGDTRGVEDAPRLQVLPGER